MIEGGTGGTNTQTGKMFEDKVNIGLEEFFECSDKSGIYSHIDNKISYIPSSSRLRPDAWKIGNKAIYVIEQKNQNVAGSTDEKIRHGAFTRDYFYQPFFNKPVVFIYILSDWFKQSKFNWVLKGLEKENIKVFFHDEINKLIEFVEQNERD